MSHRHPAGLGFRDADAARRRRLTARAEGDRRGDRFDRRLMARPHLLLACLLPPPRQLWEPHLSPVLRTLPCLHVIIRLITNRMVIIMRPRFLPNVLNRPRLPAVISGMPTAPMSILIPIAPSTRLSGIHRLNRMIPSFLLSLCRPPHLNNRSLRPCLLPRKLIMMDLFLFLLQLFRTLQNAPPLKLLGPICTIVPNLGRNRRSIGSAILPKGTFTNPRLRNVDSHRMQLPPFVQHLILIPIKMSRLMRMEDHHQSVSLLRTHLCNSHTRHICPHHLYIHHHLSSQT